MAFLSDADASVFKNVYMDGFLDVSSQLIVRGNITAVNTTGELNLRVNNVNQMTLRSGNFRAFKPVNNDNSNAFNTTNNNILARTIATNITFNGGVLVVLFNTTGIRIQKQVLGTFTLRCMNSSIEQQWSIVSNLFFDLNFVHLNFGTNTGIFTGIPAQTGAFLQLVRGEGGMLQDTNDFTNVTILELPLS